MDNLEWAWGDNRRFGLIHADDATRRRTTKSSGRWSRSFLTGSEEIRA
jgi:beta-glucosidase